MVSEKTEKKDKGKPTSFTRRRLLKYGSAAALVLTASYTFAIERKRLQFNSYDIQIPRWPKEFNGFTLALLTDLHYKFFLSLADVRDILREVERLKPDLVAVTGDIVDGTADERAMLEIWSELEKLGQRLSLAIVFGNHDHWACGISLIESLTREEISLRHKTKRLERGGVGITIAGDGDLWEDSTGIDRLLKGVPQNEPRIVLAHNPDAADRPSIEPVDLMLCGHTHGGQIDFPFLGPPFLSVENRKYCHGFVEGPNYPVFISRGIGSAILPMRLNCPPEVALLTIYRA